MITPLLFHSLVIAVIATAGGQSEVVRVNVGGRVFTTTMATLSNIPFFNGLFETGCDIDRDHNGLIFIDRNPDFFADVLENARNGGVDVIEEPKATFDYFGVQSDRPSEFDPAKVVFQFLEESYRSPRFDDRPLYYDCCALIFRRDAYSDHPDDAPSSPEISNITNHLFAKLGWELSQTAEIRLGDCKRLVEGPVFGQTQKGLLFRASGGSFQTRPPFMADNEQAFRHYFAKGPSAKRLRLERILVQEFFVEIKPLFGM